MQVRRILSYRMFQVRIHGRGGQGVVTAAELLSVAAFLEGKHAQVFAYSI
jgi:pyruvate ferredoxin oxidoreductase gamma subunit